MTYVLVSLQGDVATAEADKIAEMLKGHRIPRRSFRGANPEHHQVKGEVRETARAVFIGHNGKYQGIASLRAQAYGSHWARGADLGSMCQGARVYAFACETMGKGGVEDETALGREARQAGVAAFAGHTIDVDSDWPSEIDEKYIDVVAKAFTSMVFAFLDGENDVQKLKLRSKLALAESRPSEPWILNDPATFDEIVLGDKLDRAIRHLSVVA